LIATYGKSELTEREKEELRNLVDEVDRGLRTRFLSISPSLFPSVSQSPIPYLVYDIADKSVSVGVSFE